MSRTRIVSILAMSISVAFVATVASGWTGPTGAPPNNNVAAPINTSAAGQVKTGDFATQGKMGVGTVSPSASYKLDVYNSTAGQGKGYFHGPDGGIYIGPLNNSWSHIYTDNPMQPFIFNAGIANTAGVFASYNGDLTLSTNFSATTTTPRLTVQQSTGNVGIGTTNPGYKLQVAGTFPGIGIHDSSAAAAGYKGTLGFTRIRASDSAIEPLAYIQSIAIDNQAAGGLRIVTRNNADVEAVRINNLGNVHMANGLILGPSSNRYGASPLTIETLGNGQWAQIVNYNLAAPSGQYGVYSYGSVYALYGSGPIYGSSFVYASDARRKHNVKDLDQGLVALMKLRPVSFTWNEDNGPDDSKGKDDIGFIAQEVQQVLPGLIHEDPKTTYLEVDYPRLIPVLTQAIKEQQVHIEAQEQEIASLKTRLEALEAKLK